MFYIKTPKTITVTGRKRILAVGTEVKKLGLDGSDEVIFLQLLEGFDLVEHYPMVLVCAVEELGEIMFSRSRQ
jgi:hypothetical protein